MSWNVAGRTVFITGAARGIGAESARRLHARGANLALVGLEPERLEELAAELGGRAAVFEADVTDHEALEHAAVRALERFGAIDVAIANAGLHFVGAVTTAPLAQLQRELDVNLNGVLHTMRATAPYVTERRGYLLSVASLAAASHAPLMGAYAASKAGVEALTDCLRLELRPAGVRVGCAYFGFIDTDLVRGAMEHRSSRTMERMMPGFVRRPVPVSVAADAIERAVLRRSARVWAPRYVGAALALRGVLQPAFERRAMGDRRLRDALAEVDPDRGHLAGQDPRLGIAVPDHRESQTPTTPEAR